MLEVLDGGTPQHLITRRNLELFAITFSNLLKFAHLELIKCDGRCYTWRYACSKASSNIHLCSPSAHQELTAFYKHDELPRLGPRDPPHSGSE
jgi:hypothetical protein